MDVIKSDAAPENRVHALDDYQAAAAGTAIYPAGSLAYLALGLNGEAGEVAEIVKRSIRSGKALNQDEIERLVLELGDCLWYVANTARELGVSLSDVASINVEKLRSRQARGMLQGSGDKR